MQQTFRSVLYVKAAAIKYLVKISEEHDILPSSWTAVRPQKEVPIYISRVAIRTISKLMLVAIFGRYGARSIPLCTIRARFSATLAFWRKSEVNVIVA